MRTSMKKINILLCVFLLIPIISITLLIAKNSHNHQSSNADVSGVLYLPHRSTTITQSPQEYLNSFLPSGFVVLMFFAEWCPPCQRMCPLIDVAANTLSDVTFLKVNRDYFKDLAQLYDITSIPTLIFLHDGREIGRYDGGALTQKKLNKLVKKYTQVN